MTLQTTSVPHDATTAYRSAHLADGLGQSPTQAVLVLVNMARLGTLDYSIVRGLAQAVGELLPARAPYLA